MILITVIRHDNKTMIIVILKYVGVVLVCVVVRAVRRCCCASRPPLRRSSVTLHFGVVPPSFPRRVVCVVRVGGDALARTAVVPSVVSAVFAVVGPQLVRRQVGCTQAYQVQRS